MQVITSIDNPDDFKEVMQQLCLGVSDNSIESKALCNRLDSLLKIREGATILYGTIYDLITKEPVEGVLIRNNINSKNRTSDAHGLFRIDFKINSETSVVLTFQKVGYLDETIGINLNPNTKHMIGHFIQSI